MFKNRILLLILLWQPLVSMAFESGEKIALNQCVACHGEKGNSNVGLWPKLGGQHQDYLYQQMLAFKQGKLRNDPMMTPLMQGLSKEDMQALAHYYSQQEVVVGYAKKENLKQGESLYRGGDLNKHIAACIACHGPKGLGNAEADFPLLSGQQPEYIVKQLKAYKEGQRKTDINAIMQDISKRMDDKDMEAVANYIHGLH